MTVTTNAREHLFVEKYRPQSINETILPKRYKDFFKAMVAKGELQNLLLVGGAGTGKTTVAKALCNELDCDYIVINCSENGNIDTLRTTIRQFASSVSLDGNTKVVILDESDGLTNVTQQALRNFIEEFSRGCRFIFTANFKNKIIEPLHSRLVEVEFTLTKEEKLEVFMQWKPRVAEILKAENIAYDDKMLTELLATTFPDFRKTLNQIQRYSVDGELKPVVMGFIGSDAVAGIYAMLKDKKFSEMRKWVAENPDNDFNSLASALWARVDEFVQPDSIPQFLIHYNTYQYKNSFVVNKEINLMAFLTELMVDVQFK